MATPSVYIETTIVSYLAARPSRDILTLGHQILTTEWWNRVRPNVRGFISQHVLDEAMRGDAALARRRVELLKEFPVLAMSGDVGRLASTYFSRHLIPRSQVVDALHLAVASVHGMDYILTWNIKHMASLLVRKRLGEINAKHGYSAPLICTPEELMDI